MDGKRKLITTGVAVLALGGIGAGTAIAQSSGDPAPQVQSDQDTTDFTPANEQGQPEPADNEASDGSEKADAPEADGTNHEDPDGANVDYTPAGEQPEAENQG